jgi:hypothetical protein
MDRIAIASIFLTIALAQTGSSRPPSQNELSKITNCVLQRCASWDSYKQLDTRNFQVEFWRNQKRYVLFVSLSSQEGRPARMDYEVRPETPDISTLESFGCSLDGNVPFKDSTAPYGFSGRRPEMLNPPFFIGPNKPEYWQGRFNQAVADTLAFIDAHPQ